ncbi:MAG: ABC transporter substrate-binding protein, partial [Clostridia bacterium]|nr:ABC transporter substrate-binding protein [Clostridia bacterium]
SKYNNSQLFYVSNLTKETATNFKNKQLNYSDVASTYSYLFNTSSKLLSNPSVRYALSIAIDRNEIANMVGCGVKPATGLVPSMIFDTKKGSSFRKAGGNVLDANGQLEVAKQILADAGINPAAYDDIYLYYLTDSVNDSYSSTANGFNSKEKAIARYVEQVWESLGFYVTLKAVDGKELEDVIKSGEYDAIGLDYQMLSSYALYELAAFATAYSGSVDMNSIDENGNYASVAGISGYSSAAYDELIEKAFATTNAKEKSAILHEAEELLLKEGGIMPIVFNSDCYVVSNQLSGFKTNYWGAKIFTRVSLKDYEQYLN